MSRNAPSEQTLAQVESVLTDKGAPLRIVWRRVDCWSDSYIAQVLRALVKDGRAIADGELKERVYRRAA